MENFDPVLPPVIEKEMGSLFESVAVTLMTFVPVELVSGMVSE